MTGYEGFTREDLRREKRMLEAELEHGNPHRSHQHETDMSDLKRELESRKEGER